MTYPFLNVQIGLLFSTHLGITVCLKGSYGPQCQLKCSDRHCLYPISVCNPPMGTCEGGCQNGWTGIDCKRGSGMHLIRIWLSLYSKSSAIMEVSNA